MLKNKVPFILALVPISVVAGIFVGYYQIDMLSEEMVSDAVAQLGSVELLLAITAAQTMLYALFCGIVGSILADKIGLWKPFELNAKKLFVTFGISLVGGILFSLDYWVFGSLIDGVQSADASGLTINGVIASVLYGGIIEEVMMRLFLMSLIAFAIYKLFYKDRDKYAIPSSVFVIANVFAALLFAAGHLPATVATFPTLTPLILVRCFLLNGGFGLIFGWLYRKYGIAYAMIAHALLHIVSKTIWFIFI